MPWPETAEATRLARTRGLVSLDCPSPPDMGVKKGSAMDTVPASTSTHQTEPALLRLADIEEKRTTWLWQGYLPLGEVVLLDGDPGAGKTFVCEAWMAALSTAKGLPGCLGLPGPDFARPLASILVTTEDDPGTVIKPRLLAMGANLDHIHVKVGREAPDGSVLPWTLDHLDDLARDIEHTQAALVVLDTLQSYTGERNINDYGKMAPLMAALVDL